MPEKSITDKVLALSSRGAGTVDINDIYIPPSRMRERTPKVIDYIATQLAPSIAEYGYIQPPVLNKPKTPIEADGRTYHYELIAGCCRLDAGKLLTLERIPYNTRSSLNAGQKAGLELEENHIRLDFTWQETVLGIYTTHQIKATTARGKKEQWGYRQTGALLKQSHANIRNACIVAEALLAKDEAVMGAKNISEAIRILLGRKEDASLKRLATLTGATVTSPPIVKTPVKGQLPMGPVRESKGIDIASIIGTGQDSAPVTATAQSSEPILFDLSNKVLHMDNAEFFASCAPESFDFVYTDIPYGIDMDNLDFNAADLERVKDSHDVDENVEQMKGFLKGAYKVLKDKTYCIFWYDIAHQEKLLAWGQEAGFSVQPYPLIWVKEHPCRCRAAGQWWTKTFEYAMVMRKGNATLNTPQNKGHFLADGSAERKMQRNPFAKPFVVSSQILEAVTIPGMKMLDPYAGEGSLVRAGLNMKLDVTAVEKDEKHYYPLLEHYKQTLNTITRGRAQFQ